MSIIIRHPDINLLVGIDPLYEGATSGEWGILADVCAPFLKDPAATASDLKALADATTWDFAPLALNVTFEGDTLTIADQSAGMVALDLFSRVLSGQWREIALVAAQAPNPSSTIRSPYSIVKASLGYMPIADALDILRIKHQGPNTWPDHPAASLGVAESCAASKLAYHAYKKLGGGTPGAPTFGLSTPVQVVKD